MTKITLNQNVKFVQELRDSIEYNFDFSNKPINRLEITNNISHDNILNKKKRLLELKKKLIQLKIVI